MATKSTKPKTSSTVLKPTEDRLLVRPVEQEEQTRSGIYIPDTAKEKPQEGEVIAVGPGKKTDEGKRLEMVVKVGNRIMYSKYGGTEIKVDGEDLLIMRESDVLGIVS